jgi:hypothetical protein
MKKRSITLTYNANVNDDGTGAQIQRILGIYAICRKYGFFYLHTPIKNLVTHPLDSFQSSKELQEYLTRVNEYFNLPSDGPLQFDKVIDQARISIKYLRRLQLIMRLSKAKKILVEISNPGSIVDADPDILKLAVSDLPHLSGIESKTKVSIILHIRRDVQGDFVITGESEPRSLPIDYYKGELRTILASLDLKSEYEIAVFTDIPKSAFQFKPRTQDLELWRRAGHKLVDGKIQVDALDLEKEFEEFQPNIEFVYGGDPLDAIIQMSTADYFVMSRSSLSYLVGILNQNGKIFYPPKFWAAPLSNWILK